MAERNTRVRASQIRSILPADIEATNAPTDGYVPSYNEAEEKFTWLEQAGGVIDKIIEGDSYVEVIDAGDGYIKFVEDNAEIMRITGGKIGIGTNTPEGLFHVAKSNDSNLIYFDTYDDNSGNRTSIYLRKSHTDAIGTTVRTVNTEELGIISFLGVVATPTWNYGARIGAYQDGATSTYIPTNLILWTFSNIKENTNQLVLHNDGYIGIGTNTPGTKLDVVGSIRAKQTNDNIFIFMDCYDDGASYPYLAFRKSDTDILGNFAETDDGDVLGKIIFYGIRPPADTDLGIEITAIQDGAASTKVPTNLKFETYSATTINSNQLVLHNDGKIGIGTDTPTAQLEINCDGTYHGLYLHQDGVLANSKYGLYIYSNADQDNSYLVHFHQDNAGSSQAVLYITNDSNAPSIYDNSGAQLLSGVWLNAVSTFAEKTNIAELVIEGYIEKLKNLKLYKYQKKIEKYGSKVNGEYSKEIKNDNVRYYEGYILDDPTTPEQLISRNLNGSIQGVSSADGINFLLAICKEQQNKIEELEARIIELET